MHDNLVEMIASSMQRQYYKEMQNEILKWEKRPAPERSVWRGIARTAIGIIEKLQFHAPQPKGRRTSAARRRSALSLVAANPNSDDSADK